MHRQRQKMKKMKRKFSFLNVNAQKQLHFEKRNIHKTGTDLPKSNTQSAPKMATNSSEFPSTVK